MFSSYPHYSHLTKSDVEYSEDIARFYIALPPFFVVSSYKPDKIDREKNC